MYASVQSELIIFSSTYSTVTMDAVRGQRSPDQPARMRRLNTACVVRKSHKGHFHAFRIICKKYHNDFMILIQNQHAFEQKRQKMYLRRIPNEDSDQPLHSCSLIRIFIGRIVDRQGHKTFSMRTSKILMRSCEWTDRPESSLGAH